MLAMKQILQNLKSGETEAVEVPCPQNRPGHLLIRTLTSLVSAGTERMLVEFGRSNLLDKARQQPDKVKQVLDKVKTDGLMSTYEAVKSKLDQPLPLGYCNVGEVVEVGQGVTGFEVGDRVVSNGHHAQMVCVPKNLCAKIPNTVSNEAAAFTVLASIGLQGIRLAKPTLGERFVVTGLGLIGLLTGQILQAQGCQVLGIDFDPDKIKLAQSLGFNTVDLSKGEDPIDKARIFSKDQGVDGVLITASTESNEPVHQAAQMCRKRGRIVLIGVTGLELSRADFYEKELSFQVSCSYGPGRYDPLYESKGHDYPLGFVRWTEQRNFEAILDLLENLSLKTENLISHRFPLEQTKEAYDLLASKKPALGILLQYPHNEAQSTSALKENRVQLVPQAIANQPATLGVLGAGNYASRFLIPAFQAAQASLKTLVSQGGLSGVHHGKKLGFQETTTDAEALFSDNSIDTIVIATQHNSHAKYVIKALNAGKNIFVEKPLCLTLSELQEIHKAQESQGQTRLMVGFNRRFSPQIQKIQTLLNSSSATKSFIMTINAGAIPADHWTQDPEIGGGRLIGEACHFIDLLRFLAGHSISKADVHYLKPLSAQTPRDSFTINLEFSDGSLGSIHYLANGHTAIAKERLEVFCEGKVLQLDNFRKLTGFGWSNFTKMNLWNQNKGQKECVQAFVSAIKKGEPSPIPFEEILEVSKVTIQLAQT